MEIHEFALTISGEIDFRGFRETVTKVSFLSAVNTMLVLYSATLYIL